MTVKKHNAESGGLFKKDTPKMPEGYYSGDKPNLNLRAFIEQHLKESRYYPETDNYDVPSFSKPIETTKATAIYNMHTYWSKKPHEAIREYIRHYTRPGDLVLDPFCGSGGTALAALMEGRKAIATDLSPAATFITAGCLIELPLHMTTQIYKEFLATWQKDCGWLYEISCPTCGRTARIDSVIHSDRYECLKCLSAIPIHSLIDRVACPRCHDEISVRRNKRIDMVPVSASITCRYCGNRNRYFDTAFVAEYNRRTQLVNDALKAIRVPHAKIAEARVRMGRMRTTGTEHVDELYYPRSLYAMAWAFEKALDIDGQIGLFIRLCLTSMCLFVTKMHQANENTGGNISKGSYYIPPVNKELNPFLAFERKAKSISKGCASLDFQCHDVLVSTESAMDLSSIRASSVDYIFTDPPYSDKVPFSDLNLPWEAWLRFDTSWWPMEIIVHPDQKKGLQEWREMMLKAFLRMYEVLKPGRWLSLCYHDTSEGSWSLVQDIAAEAGFICDRNQNVLYIEMLQKSYQQIVADKVNKRDLVINFRKPRAREVAAVVAITGEEDKATFNEKVHEIIRNYLAAHPGATKDRIYDEVVSQMVRAGRMEPHDFEELLRQVAEEVKTPIKRDLFRDEEPNIFGTHEAKRWYLREDGSGVADAAEIAKEDKVASELGSFIREHLGKCPGEDGVHYSDLFERYVYAVKDKPRRQLIEFLPDYFYKTESGTWRLPGSQEEDRAKQDVRAQGLGRRIKRYLARLEQGAAIRETERPNDATIAEWIRHCKRAGLYEQGKTLYERAGLNLNSLSEEAIVNAEEDYQICVRMLTSNAKSVTKGRKTMKRER